MSLRHSTLALALFAACPVSAQAEVISVAARDVPGLVEAIDHANRTPGDHIIELAPKSLYALVESAPGVEGQGLPTLRGNIRILGNGSEIRRYSSQALLLLSVAESANVRIEHLTLAEGDRGAVLNRGRLDLRHVHLVDNTAHGADAIVRNYGYLHAADSQFAYNEIAGAQRDAGIVLNYGDVDLERSSFEANWVSRRYGSLAEASAILNYGHAELREVAVSRNAADDEREDDRIGTLVNLGNGTLTAQNVQFNDNLPDTTNRLPLNVQQH